MSTAREVVAGEPARAAMTRGLLGAVRVVSACYGPRGRLVLLENAVGDPFGVTPPTLTRDGQAVLEEAELGTPAERLGVHLLQQTVGEVGAAHGDATTTAAIVCGTLAAGALALRTAGFGPEDLAASISTGVSVARERLAAQGRAPSEDELAAMAARRAPSAALASALVEAVRVADGGVIDIDVVEGEEDAVEVVGLEGVCWDFAATDESLRAEGPMLLAFFEDELARVEEVMVPVEAARAAGRGLVLIAPAYSEDVLTLLDMNRRRLPLAAYTAPFDPQWRRTLLDDVRAALGGVAEVVVACEGQGVRLLAASASPASSASSARSVNGEAGSRRRRWLERALAAAEPGFERDRLRQRLSILQPGARLRVGAPTRVLAKSRRRQLENALASLREARLGGVVPGGGAALLYAAGVDRRGVLGCVDDALRAPIRALLATIDLEPATVLASMRSPEAFDVRRRTAVDAWETGLLDPVAPLDAVLGKSASLAALLLRSELVIVDGTELGNPA